MTETARPSKRPPRTARNKMMDLLARRDHSEKELRRKLLETFEPVQVDAALEYARENGWLLESGVLAGKFADQMHRRNKGIRSINHKLKEKGLPGVAADAELELEKALRLAETKLSRLRTIDSKARERIGRFLLSRGFEPSIVRKVVYEKL